MLDREWERCYSRSMATKKNGTLVRTDLTTREYQRIRKQAIDAGEFTSKYVGDALRAALLKGAKT
jgi:hypothetical protein